MIAGKYRLERELAKGGMGAVWVARHLQLDAPVAVKFMSPSLPEPREARLRFAREARAAARLRGPHVVQVLDHGADGDVPYIVMELLLGEHLGDRLKRERRLDLRAAASIASQVGRALDRAHRAGIVHRDLKPANVFLARVDDEETVKVLDFGIHKSLHTGEPDVTGTDVLVGSPQYMSPEQARGAKLVDHRADLWSLGAILYRAVTGAPAFDGMSAVDVLVHICTGPTPVASHVLPDLPAEIDAFFLRALARDPDERFPSAREMTDAFDLLVHRASSGERRAERPRARDEGDDQVTFVLPRRVSEPPRLARAAGASPAEIEAFVERAFGFLLSDAAPSSTEPAPPTTRCAPGRSHPPSSPGPASGGLLAPLPTRPALERLASGSFGPPRTEESGPRPVGERPAGSVAYLIDEGFTALRRGEPDSARKAWREALGLDPNNRTLALNLRRLDAMGSAAR